MRSGKSMILASIAGSHHERMQLRRVRRASGQLRAKGRKPSAGSRTRQKRVDADRAKTPDLEAHSAYVFRFSLARESRRNSRGNAKLLSELSRLLPLVLAIASLNLYSKVSS